MISLCNERVQISKGCLVISVTEDYSQAITLSGEFASGNIIFVSLKVIQNVHMLYVCTTLIILTLLARMLHSPNYLHTTTTTTTTITQSAT